MAYPHLDRGELERRVKENENVWLETTSAIVVNVVLTAVTLPALGWVATLVAVAVATVPVVLITRRVERAWARYHSVPLAMYTELLQRYVRQRSETLDVLNDAAESLTQLNLTYPLERDGSTSPKLAPNLGLRPKDRAKYDALLSWLNISKRILAKRMELGLSQDALGRAAGSKQATISELELMKADPRLSTLDRIAREIGMAVDFVPRDLALRGTPYERPNPTFPSWHVAATDAYRYARLGELQEWWREIAPPDEAGNELWLPVEGDACAICDEEQVVHLLDLAEAQQSRIAALEAEREEERKRLDWLLHWLHKNHWTVAHRLGGDVQEMRQGIEYNLAKKEGADG